ncbi:hypothetical protein [Comamonas odontotermitis]|uniref:hypothetical protein n=1 Tax=Comamonas odontotermitis TaxID=379895 RepID=UPI001CC39178|nr:hypothetical protein [Comamonas odontotermitis]UBB17712.1 hypothetical protein LAD35_03430 [Comamonas odontotermitis]
MASVADPSTALHGDALDAYLDHVETIFDSDDDEAQPLEWPARQTAASERLGQQAMQPDDLDQLRRIYRLWSMSGQPARALAAVQQHQERLLGDLSHTAQRDAAVTMGMMQADAAEDIRELPREQYHSVVRHAMQAVDQWGAQGDPDRAWGFLARHAQQAQAFDLQEQIFRKQHQYKSQQAERASYRAWDDAVLATRLGAIEAAKGNPTSARDFGHYAFAKLQQPGAGQDIDTNDWLRLADDIISLAPDTVASYSEWTLASLPADASPGTRRDTLAQLARLHAHSLYRQGQLDAAIAKGLEGRFALVQDSDDAMSASLIEWLVQAGRLPEAAHMAFESALHSRGTSREAGCRQALAHLGESAGAPYWALTLMAASSEAELTEFLPEGMEPEEAFAHYGAIVQQQTPNHPLWRLLQGNHLFEADRHAEALPLLEALSELPQYANGELTYRLFIARARSMGLQAALKTPYIRTDAGSWNYAMGVRMDDDWPLKEALNIAGDALPGDWPYDELLRWTKHYYEAGQARFEHWFATGQGSYKDGDIHDYSMLCNNLAIKYRYNDENYDAALALHAKGIATSPFAEHYNGILSTYIDTDNYPQIIAAGEQLWHYSRENGYSRHSPSDYFPKVAYALYQQSRNVENSIWLERLDEWWNALDDDDQRESRHDYLSSLLNQLDYYSDTHGAEVLPRLQALLPELRERKNAYLLRRAGDAMQTSGTRQEAMQIYQDAQRFSEDSHPDERKRLEDSIAELAPKLGKGTGSSAAASSKPWWKFW